MRGLIVMHCQESMTDPIELEVFENIKSIISNFNGHVIGTMNDRKQISDLIEEGHDVDLMRKENILTLKNWIVNKDIDSIYIVGLHYNVCVRHMLNRCEEVCNNIGKTWGTNFYAQVIENCTAALTANPDAPLHKDDLNRVLTMPQFRKMPECTWYDRKHLTSYSQ